MLHFRPEAPRSPDSMSLQNAMGIYPFFFAGNTSHESQSWTTRLHYGTCSEHAAPLSYRSAKATPIVAKPLCRRHDSIDHEARRMQSDPPCMVKPLLKTKGRPTARGGGGEAKDPDTTNSSLSLLPVVPFLLRRSLPFSRRSSQLSAYLYLPSHILSSRRPLR